MSFSFHWRKLYEDHQKNGAEDRRSYESRRCDYRVSRRHLNSGLLSSGGILIRNYGMRISHYKVNERDVKAIYKGHEVAAHTITHPNLTTLPEEKVIEQVENDRLALSELVGYEVVGMAYPCGGVNNDERTAEIIKNKTGIKYSRTISSTATFDISDNLYRFNPTVYHLNFDKMMELGERFLNLKTDVPKIFYIWGHSYEMDYGADYWVRLEDFFKLISGKDDIFYGTNKEVLLK